MGGGPAGGRNAARGHRGVPAGGISLALVRDAARAVPDPHAAARRTRTSTSWPSTACAPPTSASISGASSATTAKSAWARGAPSARRACASVIRCCRRPTSTTNDFFGEFRYDTVDNVNFPRHGASFQLGWKGERGVGGDAQDADLLVFDQLYAHSWGRNTAILWTSAGTQLDDDVDVVRSYFTLGGFLNMSGVTPETLVGPALRDRARHLLPAGWTRRAGIPQRAGVRRHVDRARQRVELAAAISRSAAPRPMAACSSGSIPC